MHGKKIEVEFDGQIYILFPESKNKSLASYFRCFKRKLGVDYLHRKVWQKYNGDIPPGYEVHHKDGDTTNNQIENLELITIEEHKREHIENSIALGKWSKESGHLDRIRSMTKEWHSSEDGKKWHKEHGKKIFGTECRSKIEMICVVCGGKYVTDSLVAKQKDGSKFCSNNCKSQFRRNSGVDNVNENCKVCGKEFVKNKYAKKFLCSRVCSGEYRKKRRGI